MLQHDSRRKPADLIVCMEKASHLNFREGNYECLLNPVQLLGTFRQGLKELERSGAGSDNKEDSPRKTIDAVNISRLRLSC